MSSSLFIALCTELFFFKRFCNLQVTEARLKELFSEKGIVTDVQLKYTEDGKFRRFGFVGYKTEEEASAALDFFNNTCVDTARITVEHCAGLGTLDCCVFT